MQSVQRSRLSSRLRCWQRRRTAGRAIVEQLIAQLKGEPPAHLPSERFRVTSDWLSVATMAFDLTRAAGAPASVVRAQATTGSIRANSSMSQPGSACSARRLVLHLATGGPWGWRTWIQV